MFYNWIIAQKYSFTDKVDFVCELAIPNCLLFNVIIFLKIIIITARNLPYIELYIILWIKIFTHFCAAFCAPLQFYIIIKYLKIIISVFPLVLAEMHGTLALRITTDFSVNDDCDFCLYMYIFFPNFDQNIVKLWK